jgi:ABC-2 type transport system ATP-binding protein
MTARTAAATAQPDSDSRTVAPGDVVLVADSITKTFGVKDNRVTAIRSLSVRVRAHRVTGLIGPDGAGKTTLMRLAVGLLEPDEGHITVLGLDTVHDSAAVQSSVGYMPQRFGLYEDLSVQENLDLYADLHGIPYAQRRARYDELMRLTGLTPFTGRLAGRLSGGMKQKLGLACVLVRPPELLLLDEPTVGVDPVSRRELWGIVNRFVQEEGTSVLMSTAYLDEAERCDEVIILDEGCLIGDGSPDRFRMPQAGRTFKVRAPGRRNRNVQEQLSVQPGVVDAVIQGDAVRLVLDSDVTPDAASLLPGAEGVSIDPVPPRFEDGFIAMLHERRRDARKARPPFVPDEGAADAPTDGCMISVRDVQRRFGDFYAVKNVSFDVSCGEIFGLLGANGAGKTTMFRMLCGLLPASGGTLHVAGVDVRKTAARARARIGYMSQTFSLYGALSVMDNLQFFSSAYGLARRRRRDRIDWAVSEFQLGPIVDQTSRGLPLGFQQRLALACALMHEPEIIFLDEPTSGVDPLVRREFWHRINALANQGVTVLVTTHFMEEAEYCDRMAIMMAGRILALGTPAEIKQQATSTDRPEPTMGDAFIQLIETRHETVERSA